jgi:GTP cyclohydrolase I
MNRDKHIKIEDLELAQAGHANGISIQLAEKIDYHKMEVSLTPEEKQWIIDEASLHFGRFLTALGVDWQKDPNSANTPRRVAKAYMEKWKGRYECLTDVTSFPADGYDGLVVESNIPLTSMCSHHHETIRGYVTIAYIPSLTGRVIGLSKLNRIVEHFGRRGAIQEQLTVAIHNAVSKICENNQGVAVSIDATHNCVSCRGVKHQGASMQTTKLSGCFLSEDSARSEFMMHVSDAVKKRCV